MLKGLVLQEAKDPSIGFTTKRTTGCIEQLSQLLCGPVWDGNVIDKNRRGQLLKVGYAAKYNGWTFLTRKGIQVAVDLELLRS